ncbi:MAG: hypothetical protein N4A46_13130 [Schleiferiaceae bacterium]|jgi:uncharacterized low-complexity protein|nr:hypothetical protein [Schleiferiaceae bacterium]
MENQKNTKKLISGSIILGSVIGFGGVQAAELFNYNDLGSGSEVRAQLLQSERAIDNAIELSCGEKTEGKSTEHKCGEGKCGEKAKKSSKEGKATESKCGEGKCGEKGKESKKKSAKEGKATESKCGEGKCGEGKCGGNE